MAFIAGIQTNTPAANSAAGLGDDEIRTLKGDLKTSFPNVAGEVSATQTELNIMDGCTSSTAELNILDGVTASAAELNIMDGCTSTTAELNILDGVTASATELNKMDGCTSSTAELNILDGTTTTTSELNNLPSNTTSSLSGKAALAGSTGQRFDVAAPNANDQAIRRDTYGTQTTGGTVKIWESPSGTLNISTS